MTTRLAVLTSHPIQYNAPAFRLLAADPNLDVRVFYEWDSQSATVDPEFGRLVKWDIPLLDGYNYTFVQNVSADPGSHRFRGIDNPAIVDEIRSWAPDALLVYGWSFASHLRVMREFRGKVPILFRGDSTLLDRRQGWKILARRAFLHWVYRHVDVALYAGTRNREYYRAHGLRENQLVWAPHAVDNERFADHTDSAESEARAWRDRMGISHEDTVFLFAAKLVSRKDPAILLRAFTDLRLSAPDSPAHLVFVGDGELSASLRAAAGRRTDIHFLGFQNQSAMPVAYRVGDVMVLPSIIGETWGLAVNEAMACGRAAIVSDRVGCAIDLVQPGRTGFTFEHGDPASLRDAMGEVLRDRNRVLAMGREAQKVIAEWSIDAYAGVVAKVATSVCRKNRGT